MIRVGIVGGTGYTAGELIRILINHPDVEIVSITSTSSAGKPIYETHRELIGETELLFSEKLAPCDVIFLCLGHGISREFLTNNPIEDSCKVIDLGNDFRLDGTFGERSFTYGLTDLNKEAIQKSDNVANPGCFATAIQLALLPLVKEGLISDEIHIHAITGSTGAGKSLTGTSHFSYRDNNISVYKSFTHQHLGEIKKTLSAMNGSEIPEINFVPMRGDFPRGIFASLYTECSIEDSEKVANLYKDYYKDSPFVHYSDKGISLKEVINTNKCLIHTELHNGKIHITSIIDNLIKGASGQAVENMNLMFGLDQKRGLSLKPSTF